MRYFVAFIYLALSLITRLGLLITYIPALFGWLEPTIWLGAWTVYFDDRATKAFDGE